MNKFMLIALCFPLVACAANATGQGATDTTETSDAGPEGGPQLGSDGTPASPFGGFDITAFRGDHLEATAAVNLDTYEGKPVDGNWQADFSAMEMLARYYGHTSSWCGLDTAMIGTPGTDCCNASAVFSSDTGFADAGDSDAGPLVSCGQAPGAWKVGDALASTKLRGLWAARPLTAEELRTELANGRPVLIRTSGIEFGDGALVIIAGWSPIAEGGDRFLLVREGEGYHWAAYLDIIEHREPWITIWTDSWYRVSATTDGCVPTFDAKCGH